MTDDQWKAQATYNTVLRVKRCLRGIQAARQYDDADEEETWMNRLLWVLEDHETMKGQTA